MAISISVVSFIDNNSCKKRRHFALNLNVDLSAVREVKDIQPPTFWCISDNKCTRPGTPLDSILLAFFFHFYCKGKRGFKEQETP